MTTVNLTHRELLELISVVKAHRKAAIDQRNKAEIKLMNELIRALMTFDIDRLGTAIMLDRTTRFSLWLCMENYINFCAETEQYEEYAVAVTISTKLSG